MKRSLALLTSTALLLPAAVLVAPAEAASDRITDPVPCDNLGCGGEIREAPVRIKNCYKSQHGTTVRIKIRSSADEDYTRVRLSHPRGRGNFDNNKVKRVDGVVDTDSGTANSRDYRMGLAPSHRLGEAAGNGVTVNVLLTFKLRNGKSINLDCTMR